MDEAPKDKDKRTEATESVTIRLKNLRERVEAWRRTRTGRTRVPDDLVADALRLAEHFGAYRTAEATGIRYQTLKKRMTAEDSGNGDRKRWRNIGAKSRPFIGRSVTRKGRTSKEKPVNFVDLGPMMSWTPAASPIVELADEDGGRLTLRLAPGMAVDVAGIVAAFRRTVKE